ncbi:hypothetical protein F2Q68_00004807 [Brassica cretica]|uniref:Uncharacterized protein n=1 Tax=Brassica cretica TaxID=69181 RepID=A0A8S9JAA8_BRACR|nr:hypothetical protein F2Q68_00004807 [Brassica cretica]
MFDLFKGVHSGLGTPLRSVGTGGYLRSSRKGFGRGFGQGSKPQRTKHSRIAGTSVWYRALPIACLISNARLVFWVLRGKEGYGYMSVILDVLTRVPCGCELGELLVLDCLWLGWRGVVFVSWGPGSLSDIMLLIKITYRCMNLNGRPGSVEAGR